MNNSRSASGTALLRPTVVPIPAPVESDAIPLDSGRGLSHMPAERWFTLAGKASVRNVAEATLTPVLPTGGNTGAAVIVAAGGGYLIESMENEAWPQARWLADRGIAAFVLKYRLQPTPADDEAFGTALVERFVAAAAAAGARDQPRSEVPSFMVTDAQAAIRRIRASAAGWAINPRHVGWLGFSAGAMMGLGTVAAGEKDAMPDFLATVYPSMASVTVAANAPPLFAAIAADDQLYGRQGYGLAESWCRAERPVELHVYERGGHGFGMGVPGTTSTGLMDAFYAWLRCNGWLDAGAPGDRRP